MATLVRKPVQFPEVTEATLNQQVAREAETYLGYSFGERRNTEVTTRLSRRATLVKVQGILKSLGIVPLVEASVLRYQRQKRASALRRTRFTNSRWNWRLVALEDYKAEIPQFALARATQVAKALNRRMPSLKKGFLVSELHRTRVRPENAYHPDPFMVLQVLEQNFYLDVWNEPSFEGRRTV
jgi:hypothetical protein